MLESTPLVCVVDDDDMVRESLCLLIATVGHAAKGYASARAFLGDDTVRDCDCLILDVRMPGISGIELQERLAREHPDIPVIFISGHGDIPMAVRTMRLGALDFLQKPFAEQTLLDRVQEAVDRSTQQRRQHVERAALVARYDLLTERERDVLEALLSGAANKQIADQLGISSRTVEQHRASLMRKMRVASIAELVTAIGRLRNSE
jgi:RNA polymerase sigma factor (sigma-70 family)